MTLAVFAAAMAMIVFAEYPAESDRIIMVSIAIGPVLMISVMVGYSVWWGVLFLLSLFLPSEKSRNPYEAAPD